MFAAHLQGAQSQHTEANLARELQTQLHSTFKARSTNYATIKNVEKKIFFR